MSLRIASRSHSTGNNTHTHRKRYSMSLVHTVTSRHEVFVSRVRAGSASESVCVVSPHCSVELVSKAPHENGGMIPVSIHLRDKIYDDLVALVLGGHWMLS